MLTCLHTHTHTHTHTHIHTHNQILHLCRCCHGPTLQPPIFPPALLFFLCSQTAHRHVQVSPLGSLAWQEACFQSFALFSLPLLLFSPSWVFSSVPVLANYRHILLLPTACCCRCLPTSHRPLLPHSSVSLSPSSLGGSGESGERDVEVEGGAGVQMCINEAVKGRGWLIERGREREGARSKRRFACRDNEIHHFYNAFLSIYLFFSPSTSSPHHPAFSHFLAPPLALLYLLASLLCSPACCHCWFE